MILTSSKNKNSLLFKQIKYNTKKFKCKSFSLWLPYHIGQKFQAIW